MGSAGWVAMTLAFVMGIATLLGAVFDQISSLSRKALGALAAIREVRAAWRDPGKVEEPTHGPAHHDAPR
ncbi:hypothetical protein AB0E96_14380 [Kitasatospora sp. NPDC036755]|uniref:hypothetical protein n=1 Tax=Kitasatospora sp. NPDC036755 TaxID=3154600 RepID=UPI00340D7117